MNNNGNTRIEFDFDSCKNSAGNFATCSRISTVLLSYFHRLGAFSYYSGDQVTSTINNPKLGYTYPPQFPSSNFNPRDAHRVTFILQSEWKTREASGEAASHENRLSLPNPSSFIPLICIIIHFCLRVGSEEKWLTALSLIFSQDNVFIRWGVLKH